FAHLDGRPRQPATLTHAFTKIARKAGFPGLRLHDCRHTHASLLLKLGVNPKIVSERLGHSSIVLTLDTYSHLLPGMQEEAVLKFDRLTVGTPFEAVPAAAD
ncbi:MAG: site-specific integrase, partial [Dehalococcoidia bacterium]